MPRGFRARRCVATVAAVLGLGGTLLAGCAASSASPSPTHPADFLEHPIGATELVLRYEEGGGFVAPSFLVTEGPTFSLYGDGTVIFRDPTANPPAKVGTVSFNTPYQVAKLTEEQIQALLQFAIGPGGLAASRASYQLPIADAPTTTFTITAGSITKTTSVNGLGLDVQPGPDTVTLQQLAALRTRLQGFGGEVVGEQPWSPDRYRGVLMPAEGQSVTGALAWPWTTIQPADFLPPANPNDGTFPRRTLLPADVAGIGIAEVNGGARGIFLLGPDGKTYELGLRPLLPDEKA